MIEEGWLNDPRAQVGRHLITPVLAIDFDDGGGKIGIAMRTAPAGNQRIKMTIKEFDIGDTFWTRVGQRQRSTTVLRDPSGEIIETRAVGPP